VLDDGGIHYDAEAEHRQVLKIREKMLGPEHPDTLRSRNNLIYPNGALSATNYLSSGYVPEPMYSAEYVSNFAVEPTGGAFFTS